jgi:DNA-binding CsgD family transcriptional regulator
MDGAPLTFGAARPTVVVPPELDGGALECVLVHEAVHARRRDNLWHYGMAAALIVYWWNPAVWLMSRLLRRDIELACDRAAVKRLGAARRAEYAQTLVALATASDGPAFCQTFGRKAAEERIISVMKFKKTTIFGVVLSLVLVAGVTAAFASAPKAPDEDREFCVMERYRYLTKVRCYLSIGEYLKAQALLEKLRYYTEKCRRTYVRMEVCLLSAIAKYRTGGAWKEEFLSALKEACGYRFIRLISEEGAAVQELFVAAGKSFLEKEIPDKEWLSRLMGETGKVAVRYPVYLKGQLAKAPDFCEAALSVLRLQAEGKSVGKIAQELYMKEATVKYHAKENYRKLGVSGKADAVLAARNLGIL